MKRSLRILIFVVVLIAGYFAFKVLTKKDTAVKPSATSSRIIPMETTYVFDSRSPIKDPNVVTVQSARLFKEAGQSRFYFQIVNKSSDPITAGGDVFFFNTQGEEIFRDVSDPGSLGEIFGQAQPGSCETANIPMSFDAFDINTIARGRIIIRTAMVDDADRD